MKEHLASMLKSAAEADRQRALLTLELLSNHAVGIGDHSTGDFYKNADRVSQGVLNTRVAEATHVATCR